MVSISAAVSSGNAAHRLRRARLVIPRKGPISRPVKPPSAEAQPSGSKPSAPMSSVASQASPRYRQAMSDRAGSGGIGASVIADPADEGRQQRVEGCRITPAQRDVENLDAGTLARRQPHPILPCRDRQRTGRLRLAAQRGEFGGAVDMMVGKAPLGDERGAQFAQAGEEFPRAANTGKSNNGSAGEPVAGGRFQRGVKYRGRGGDGNRAVSDQHDRVGAVEAVGDPLTQWSRRDQLTIAKAVVGIDHNERAILGDTRVLKA